MVYRPESLLERLESLRGLGGFRNVLAHEYVGLVDATVHEHMVKMNGVFSVLAQELERLVESSDAPKGACG